MNIKKNYERKKSKQMKRLNEIEKEREMLSQKVLDKIHKNNSSFIERSSKSYDNFLKKSERIKEIQEKKEQMHEEFIRNSLGRYIDKEQKIKEKIQEDMISKSLKAKSMSKNLMDDRKLLEDEKIETDFAKFLNKLKKNQEKKKQINEAIKNQIFFKKNKEIQRENEVKKRLNYQEQMILKKSQEIEKNAYKNMEKSIHKKHEEHKNKIIQNEIELLSAKTRISRINSKYV